MQTLTHSEAAHTESHADHHPDQRGVMSWTQVEGVFLCRLNLGAAHYLADGGCMLSPHMSIFKAPEKVISTVFEVSNSSLADQAAVPLTCLEDVASFDATCS